MKPIVLIPMAPTLPKVLKDLCRRQAQDLFSMSSWPVVIDERGAGDAGIETLQERVVHTCRIKNEMLEDHALNKGYSHVMWLDADLLWDPAQMVRFMSHWAVSAGVVAAPGVYLHGQFPRWYDTAGFVRDGQPFQLWPPYCERPHDQAVVFDCEGVGCAYLVPAAVYEAGVRHEPVEGFTDHLHVCRAARALGCAVKCDLRFAVHHAFLPDFGVRLH